MGPPSPVRRPDGEDRRRTAATTMPGLRPPPMLLLLLQAWPLLGAPPAEPPAVCGPEGCYAVYFQRRSFLEAWRGCRELGGNLATFKRPEEAAQVSQLLRSPAVGSGVGGVDGVGEPQPSRRLLWIGLQRQPRQCYPQRPLRGFTWTTGDQDTAYTNWARPATTTSSSSSCSAPRCVVLDERDLQWLEGSCTVPVDGYLCRFAYRGMCPGLAERESADAASAVVSYTTPFGPADGSLLYVPFGTVAAVACRGGVVVGGAVVSVLCLQTEGGGVGWSKEPPLCREAAYPHSWCEGDNGGCQQLCLDEGGSGYSCECHDGYYLLPDGHSCAAAAANNNACQDEPCQFGCVPLKEEEEEEEEEEGGGGRGASAGYQCQCPPGYELATDGHHCEDLDECAEAPCDHQCENTEGSFLCRCHLGFSPSDEEPGQCADTDECQFPGVCQQMCVNYVGGFECYCTEGYELDTDGISCVLVAQLPPLATAESYRGGHLRPYESGHGWPLRQDLDHHHLGDGSALAHHFPVFQDVRVGSPEFETPSSFIPDPRMVPRMVPDAETPNVTPTPQDTGGLWMPHSPALLDLTETPGPTSGATMSPPPPARGFSPSTPTNDFRDLPGPPSGSRDPRTPALATTQPAPPQHLTSSPDRSGEAVVWGVRAPPPAFTTMSPIPGGEDGQRKRDDRWLLVALLVPICVFLVVMLALGIVYCTRCGAQAKARSVTQCYRWVISSAGKGAAPPPRPCQTATCRTSV